MKQFALFCTAGNVLFCCSLAIQMYFLNKPEAMFVGIYGALGWLAALLRQLND